MTDEESGDGRDRDAGDDWFEDGLDGDAAPDRPDGDGGDGEDDGDEFATAFGGDGGDDGTFEFDAADGNEAFGFGGDGGETFGFDVEAGGEEFADADFESDIPRIDLGIEGLDDMILGGVPERSLIVALGSAGTGKTTFALQFLEEAIRNGERAVYITLEESHTQLVQSAEEKGWPFGEYVADDRLAVVDLDPVEMANSLTSIRNELPGLVESFDATRLVLDSVSLLEMMYDEQAARRTEIYDFTQSLKRAGVTTLLVSEASESDPYASRHGIVEYLTDAVIVLRYVRTEDFRETRLAVEIQKIRNTNHSRETKPYEITSEGINVYRQASIF